jgi:hypothetical protein
VALRLREVELVARNLQNFTREQPSITNELRLPDWDQPAKLAWPPPQTPIAVLAVHGAMDVSASHTEREGGASSEAWQWSSDQAQPAHAFPMVRGRERLVALSQFRERSFDPRKYRGFSELGKDAPCLGQVPDRESTLFLDLVR